MPRVVESQYVDPVDLIWLHCASQVGMCIRRSRDDFASWDGKKTLKIAESELLDSDDCMAQMIFHELCHSLVEGNGSFARPDWGLDNTGEKDHTKEHACLRTQAHLADEHGLRALLAPTTDFREYYDNLPGDPLEPRYCEATKLAILAIGRASKAPWAPHLRVALEKTAAVATVVSELGSERGPDKENTKALWSLFEAPPPSHPGGLACLSGETAGAGCSNCTWRYLAGPGKKVDRCRQLEGARVRREWSACVRYEPELDCQQCAACCREAYQSVTISRRDPAVRKVPELVVDRGDYLEIRREGDHCSALAVEGDPSQGERFSCTIYDGRPRPCREFERGGPHCLTARRRLGYSL